ncbi:hypothetical protein BH23ACT10_BH23ACT10_39480 [soil metagenome]
MQDLTTTFAGYQLQEVLGTDAVSTLYRATTRPRDTGRAGPPQTVALRVSHVLDSDADRRQARVFERRAMAAMDLDHPGVAQVLDAGAADDRVYAATGVACIDHAR